MDVDTLQKEWDNAADAIEDDPMRPIRYAKGIRYFKDMPKHIRILDVGCGEGSGLAILRDMGFTNLYGIEVSEERARRAQSRLDSSAKITSIKPDDPLPYENDFFDLVVSFTVIEHTLDAVFFMKEINRVLKNNSLCIISSDCYTWRILQLLRLYKSEQPVDRALSPFTFKKVFSKAGFTILHSDTTNLPGRGNMYYYFFVEIIKIILRKIGIPLKRTSYTDKVKFDAKAISNKTYSSKDGLTFKQTIRNYLYDENIFLIQKT